MANKRVLCKTKENGETYIVQISPENVLVNETGTTSIAQTAACYLINNVNEDSLPDGIVIPDDCANEGLSNPQFFETSTNLTLISNESQGYAYLYLVNGTFMRTQDLRVGDLLVLAQTNTYKVIVITSTDATDRTDDNLHISFKEISQPTYSLSGNNRTLTLTDSAGIKTTATVDATKIFYSSTLPTSGMTKGDICIEY